MPKAGGYTFISIYMALQAYLLVLDSEKPNPDPLKWTAKRHSNSGHLEKDDIETNKFEVSYDNTKEELFEAV